MFQNKLMRLVDEMASAQGHEKLPEKKEEIMRQGSSLSRGFLGGVILLFTIVSYSSIEAQEDIEDIIEGDIRDGLPDTCETFELFQAVIKRFEERGAFVTAAIFAADDLMKEKVPDKWDFYCGECYHDGGYDVPCVKRKWREENGIPEPQPAVEEQEVKNKEPTKITEQDRWWLIENEEVTSNKAPEQENAAPETNRPYEEGLKGALLGGALFPIVGDPVESPSWSDLIKFQPSLAVSLPLQKRGLEIQRLEDGRGMVNLDLYEVRIEQLPAVEGQRVTAQELLSHVRQNLDSFVNTDLGAFRPLDRTIDRSRWESDDSQGSVIHIDMGGPNNGLVVVSERSSNHWTFTTVKGQQFFPPGEAGFHPVSGHRQFGIREEADGSVVFFTRGVDRATTVVEDLAMDVPFQVADELWQSLQRGVKDFVTSNDGRATISVPRSKRYDWNDVKLAVDIWGSEGSNR